MKPIAHALAAALFTLTPALAVANCAQLCDPAFYATATPASVQKLIDAGADVNAKGTDGKRPLYWVGAASAEIVTVLIQAGADVNARDNWDRMPIHFISGAGTPGALTLVIAAGADVNARTANDWTPLHGVAKFGGPENIMVLINAGADASLRNQMGESAFDLAVGNQRLVGSEALQLLEKSQ